MPSTPPPPEGPASDGGSGGLDSFKRLAKALFAVPKTEYEKMAREYAERQKAARVAPRGPPARADPGTVAGKRNGHGNDGGRG